MAVEHWMMFGTFASQRHFVYPTPDTYQGVLFNANMVVHARAGLAGFLLERTGGLRYLIDPQTHAFQHEPRYLLTDKDGEKSVKSSIRGLAEALGSPISELVGKLPLLPKNLEDRGVLRAMVERCCDFQAHVLSSAMKEHEAMKYLEDDDNLLPQAVVAPYFYLTDSTFEDWHPINLAALEMAKRHCANQKVFGAIVLDQGVIADQSLLKRILCDYARIETNGYILWIDNLDEVTAPRGVLENVLALAHGLRSLGREVINSHGGYFSVLAGGTLGDEAYSGVAHGPEFGEYRAVLPVGGGIPIARYYIPKLHSRIRYRDALDIFQRKGYMKSTEIFHNQVCDCQECRDTLDGNIANFTRFGDGTIREVRRGKGIVRIDYPTGETTLHCLQHYLQRKRREYAFSATASRESLLQDLEDGFEEYKDVMGLSAVGYIRNWTRVFNDNRFTTLLSN